MREETFGPVVGIMKVRDDEEARRVAVEPVHDPGSLGLLPACDLPSQEPVHEGSARVARRRMDDDPGRLVDDEQVLVLVHDGQIELLGLESALASLRDVDLELLTSLEPVALAAGRAVDEDVAVAEQAFRGRTRADLIDSREEAVETLAGRLGRHGEGELRHRSWGRAGWDSCAGSAAAARPRPMRAAMRRRRRR